MKWFNGLSTAIKLVILAVLAVGAILTYRFVDDMFSKAPETAAEVAQERQDAAIDSGQDAVNTVTRVEQTRVERYETVRTIQEDVNNAEDFNSAHDAGIDGLCKLSGICTGDDVQQPSS